MEFISDFCLCDECEVTKYCVDGTECIYDELWDENGELIYDNNEAEIIIKQNAKQFKKSKSR